MSEGRRGLTALGSLDFYKGDAKQIEDTTELMTMYAWSPEYAREFTDFLAHPDYKSVRRDVGLANMSVGASEHLYGTMTRAVDENLATV